MAIVLMLCLLCPSLASLTTPSSAPTSRRCLRWGTQVSTPGGELHWESAHELALEQACPDWLGFCPARPVGGCLCGEYSCPRGTGWLHGGGGSKLPLETSSLDFSAGARGLLRSLGPCPQRRSDNFDQGSWGGACCFRRLRGLAGSPMYQRVGLGQPTCQSHGPTKPGLAPQHCSVGPCQESPLVCDPPALQGWICRLVGCSGLVSPRGPGYLEAERPLNRQGGSVPRLL